MSALLFDIGGTSLRMALASDGAMDAVVKVPTPATPEEAVLALKDFVRKPGIKVTHACGGIAGSIEDGRILVSPNLPSWDGFLFARALADALSVPVAVHNDAALAALGEAVYGAGKGNSIVGYIGIGTGVGGALIVNGEVAPHAHGFEPGHAVLDVSDGATFESLVSGGALQKRYGIAAQDLPRKVYEERAGTLAAGLYNAMLAWSPDTLVVGGSLMNEENGYRLDDLRTALASMPHSVPALPPIARAALGDASGLYGALALASR